MATLERLAGAAPRLERERSSPAVTGTPRWLRRLRVVGVLLPVVAILALQVARPSIAEVAGEHQADLVTGILSTVAALLFGLAMFALIERGHRVIARQHRELGELNGVLTELARQQPLPRVLERTRNLVQHMLGTPDCGVVVPGSDVPLPAGPLLLAPVNGPVGARSGWIWARREVPASPADQRLLQTAADLVSLALAQVRTLEHERHVARADELDRVAREMHDSLAQVLGALHLRLRVLEAAGELTEELRSEVSELGELCHAAYQDVREAIVGLRSLTREESLPQALERYVRHYERHGGPPTTVSCPDDGIRLPEDVQLHVLRIVQEALTNVRKHACASGVEVRVSTSPEHLEVEVRDDGVGLPGGVGSHPDQAAQCQVEAPGGFGLTTMHERAALVGGELDVRSTPGRGTCVRVLLPWPPATRPEIP